MIIEGVYLGDRRIFTDHGYQRFIERILPMLGKTEGEMTPQQMVDIACQGLKNARFIWEWRESAWYLVTAYEIENTSCLFRRIENAGRRIKDEW